MSAKASPSADDLVEAVRKAGTKLAELDERIDELEQAVHTALGAAGGLSSDLGESRRALEASSAAVQDEAQRRDRAENIAAHYVRRTGSLQSDLKRVLADLMRVTEAIADGLGLREPE